MCRVSNAGPARTAITVALVDDYDVVLAGVANMLEGYRDRVGVSVRREVLRNWQFTGAAELRRYDFASIDRKDQRVMGRLEGRYLANRRYDLFVRAEGLLSRTKGSAGTLFDYDRLTVVSGAALKL